MRPIVLTIVCEQRVVVRRPLEPGARLVLGRGEDATIQLADAKASRHHLAIERDAEGVSVTDLGSRNGTLLAGAPLAPHQAARLAGPASLRIGAHTIQIGGGPPSVREDYEQLRELGRGASGAVYAARHRASGREVAIKVLAQRLEGDAAARTRFLREARVRLDSPYVVPTYEAREEQGTVFLVLELVDGVPLDERLAQGPVSLAEALRWGEHIARGLAAAHAGGVVHRDVKPANVLLDRRSGLARLADFGIAKRLVGDSLGGLTATGTGIGTITYVSPEQAEDAKRVSPQSDLYSLGATLFHLIAGRPPFPPGPELLQQLFEDDPPPLQRLVPACPKEVARLVARLLEKDPEDRPPSAQASADQLAELSARLAGGAS